MKERKLRFNFVDVLIVLIIAAVVFALAYIFVINGKNSAGSADTDNTTIRYVVRAVNIEERFDGLINVGDSVEESVERKKIGTVVGVQSVPYQKITFDYEEGKETVADVEDRVTISITIEATAVETDTAFTVDGMAIRVGQQYSLAMPGMSCSGYCIELAADIE